VGHLPPVVHILLVGLLGAAYNLLSSIKRGKIAPANPWAGTTLEWQCPSPPPHMNFEDQPDVGDPYDRSRLQWNAKSGSWDTVGAPVTTTH
jgi:cytochrome c oxidase subunit I